MDIIPEYLVTIVFSLMMAVSFFIACFFVLLVLYIIFRLWHIAKYYTRKGDKKWQEKKGVSISRKD